jgi:hypothetical protein
MITNQYPGLSIKGGGRIPGNMLGRSVLLQLFLFRLYTLPDKEHLIFFFNKKPTYSTH